MKITKRKDGFFSVEGIEGYHDRATAHRLSASLKAEKEAEEKSSQNGEPEEEATESDNENEASENDVDEIDPEDEEENAK